MKKTIIDFIKRHALYILIAALCIFGLSYIHGIPPMIKVLLQLPMITAVIIILSSVALYSYTPLNFFETPAIVVDKHGLHNVSVVAAHVKGKYIMMASIFLSISLLTAFTIFAIYFMVAGPPEIAEVLK